MTNKDRLSPPDEMTNELFKTTNKGVLPSFFFPVLELLEQPRFIEVRSRKFFVVLETLSLFRVTVVTGTVPPIGVVRSHPTDLDTLHPFCGCGPEEGYTSVRNGVYPNLWDVIRRDHPNPTVLCTFHSFEKDTLPSDRHPHLQ